MSPHELIDQQLALCSQASGTLDIDKLKDLVSAAYAENDRIADKTARAANLLVEENDQLWRNVRGYVARLRSQKERFDLLIENVSQGMAIFRASGDLAICNEKYLEHLRLPQKFSRPGCTFWDLVEYCAESEIISYDILTRKERPLREIIDAGKYVEGPLALLDGRTLFVRHHPLSDGGWLSTHVDVTEEYQYEKQIRHLTHFDGLTGVANRAAFLEEMAGCEARIKAGETMAVLRLDLNKFKPINENLGHDTGDTVLRTVAERIARVIGTRGMTARLGGDEFAVLVGNLPENEAGKLAAGEVVSAIIDAVGQPIPCETDEVKVSIRVGVAMAPQDGVDAETLMYSGDLALGCAKSDGCFAGNSGRCDYCFFRQPMTEVRRNRHAIEAGLAKALENDELELHYQPLLDLNENKVSCCEALMRWTHPKRGIIPPDEFIPIAEETGLIQEFGAWALQQACNEAMNWPEDVRVAVNVSPVQFVGNELVGQVIDALEHSGLDANRLELEITESLFLADSEHNLRILHRLRDMGVRIALDDFGTGYSSLSYFRSFPFDKIKIDRAFISNLETTSDAIAIVKAIVQLSRSLGMATTAEGIETEGQLEAVRAQGCSEIQGYLFSRPLPAHAIAGLLKRPVSYEELTPSLGEAC